MTDEQMDVRLREAGERWRAGAAHQPDMVTARPPAPAPRRPWLLLASAAVVIAALVAGAVVLWPRGSDAPAPTAARIGTGVWEARSVVPAKKTGSLPAGQVQTVGSASVQFENGRVSASDGCNAVNGTAHVRDDTIVFGQLATTLVACTSTRGETAGLIDTILNGTVTYSVTRTALVITKKGVGTLFLARAPRSSIGTGPWYESSVRDARTGRTTALPRTAPLRFHHGQMIGSDGCNSITAPARVSSDTIVIGDRTQTEIGCTGADVVDRVLIGTVHYTVTSTELVITKDGVGTLTLTRSHTAPASPVGTWVLTGTQTTHDGGGVNSGTSTNISPTADAARLVLTSGALALRGGCPQLHGGLTISGDRLILRDVTAAAGGCTGGSNDPTTATIRASVTAVLSGTVRWQVASGQLTISKGNRSLVFERSR